MKAVVMRKKKETSYEHAIKTVTHHDAFANPDTILLRVWVQCSSLVACGYLSVPVLSSH